MIRKNYELRHLNQKRTYSLVFGKVNTFYYEMNRQLFFTQNSMSPQAFCYLIN